MLTSAHARLVPQFEDMALNIVLDAARPRHKPRSLQDVISGEKEENMNTLRLMIGVYS